MPDAIAVPAEEAAYAGTDLLHRRTALVFRSHVAVNGTHVEIDANSPLMSDAICALERWDTYGGRRALAKWEIEVEVREDGVPRAPWRDEEMRYETFSFGPGRSFRMEDGSWFAHTPPSMDGVGFVFVCGDERHQILRLKSYIGLVRRLVVDGLSCEVAL